MKKIYSTILLASVLLIGCTNEGTATESDDSNQAEVTELQNQLEEANQKITDLEEQLAEIEVEEEIEDEDEDVAEENMEIDGNEPLENVGEFKYTDTGRIELLNIVRPKDSYPLTEGVDIIFDDIKIMYHSEIPESQKETHRDYYGFDDEGYSIQIIYSAKNSTDQTIGGIEIEDMVTSDGTQYNLYHNAFTLGGSNYEVRPNAVANVALAFAIDDPNTTSLNLYFQPYDADGYHLEKASINLDF